MQVETLLRVFVYRCPVKHQAQVLRLLDAVGATPVYVAKPEGLQLNECYEAHVYPDQAELLAEKLSTPGPAWRSVGSRAPGGLPYGRFVMWTEPVDDDQEGQLWAYVPQLGLFTGPCDQAGTVLRPYAKVAEAVAWSIGRIERVQGAPWRSTIAKTLAADISFLYGRPWLDDWAAGGMDRRAPRRVTRGGVQ